MSGESFKPTEVSSLPEGSSQQRKNVEGRETKDDTNRRSGDDVAEEMHAENDSGTCDEKGDRQQVSQQFWIEEYDGNRHRKSSNRMPRRERVLVRRENRCPAV